MNKIFLTAQWRQLLMLNFEIDPKILKPFVTQGTEIDYWENKTFISLVAFNFLDTRVKGIPIPFHRNFEEINLRFYVRRQAPDGWRRGVVFIKEVVPKWAIAFVARTVYNENYVALPTKSTLTLPQGESEGELSYSWKYQKTWLQLGATFNGEPILPQRDSQEEFITEHYWGYCSHKDGSTVEYQVEHPQWNAWSTSNILMKGNFIDFYGEEFSDALSSEPTSTFIADGSEINVRDGSRI